MFRKFYLKNSKAETWNFTDETFKVFLNSPQGLGISDTLTTTVYGNTARVDSEDYAFPTPSGEVLFYDDVNSDRYEKYNDFARFITHTPLTLYYTIPTSPNETYSLLCYVSSLTKTETGRDSILTCPIAFQGIDFWRGDEVTLTGNPLTITNEGDYPVGFTIEINGSSMVDPFFTLEQDDLYGECKFLMDGTTLTKVTVNSNESEQNVILQNGGVTLANPLQYQDLSISNGEIYVTFIKLARGTSTLTVDKDGGTLGTITVKFTPRYRSV